jgi:probable HAF family extracellular repeat protein
MRRLLWALAAPALLACPLPVSADYLLTDLGSLGGGFTTATALNDSGQVVGYSSTAQMYTHSFLYSGGVMKDLGTLGGSFYSYANGINSAGQVVGNSGGDPNAFLYAGGVMKDLGTLGFNWSDAAGVNASGQVVGTSATPRGYNHAFLYSGGVMKDLGTLAGPYASSAAAAINAAGQIAGYSSAGNAMHAFLYSGGVMKDLGSLNANGSSFATGLNAAGQVVGWYSTSRGLPHAFLYSGGVMQDLGTLGGIDSQAQGINSSGQVVGMAGTAAGYDHAFLYSGGKMTDLNSLLPANSGVWLRSANAINDRGQIVAVGTNDHAYLLTPDGISTAPEPSSLALLALGGAGLLGSAWRRRRRAGVPLGSRHLRGRPAEPRRAAASFPLEVCR